MIALLMLYALTTFPLSYMLALQLPPLLLIALRLGGMAIVLGSYSFFVCRSRFSLFRSHWWRLGIISFCVGMIPYFLRFISFAQLPAERCVAWYMMAPLITFIIGVIMAKERASLISFSLVLAGTIAGLVYLQVPFTLPDFHRADVFLLGSIISFAIGWSLLQDMLIAYKEHVALLVSIPLLISGLCAFPLHFVWDEAFLRIDGTMIFLLMLLIGISSVTHYWYASLARQYSLTILQMGVLVQPLLQTIVTGCPVHSMSSQLALLCMAIIWGIFYYRHTRKVAVYYPLININHSSE